MAQNSGGGGGGNSGCGGGGANKKVEEPQAHPVKEQLPGIQYCINSPPPWRLYTNPVHTVVYRFYSLPFFRFALGVNSVFI